MQKVFVNESVHTSLSSEAIRFAIRYRFQLENIPVNRSYDPSTNKYTYFDESRKCWGDGIHLIDDDIMGFLYARADRKDSDDGDDETMNADEQHSVKLSQIATRRSPLSVGRAVSMRPYKGELTFNCVGGEKNSRSLYLAETHTTEYQYSFALNLDQVAERAHTFNVLDAIMDPPNVGGNASRFYYDFSPESIVLRLTTQHSSKVQNCFLFEENSVVIPSLVRQVKSGDIDPHELFIGGTISDTKEAKLLKRRGANVHPGTTAATKALELKLKDVLTPDDGAQA